MTALIASLRALGPMRLAAMAAVALVSLGLVGMLALRSNEGPLALLYADLELREAGQVVDQLERARIPRVIEAGGTRCQCRLHSPQIGRLKIPQFGAAAVHP